MEKYAFIIIPFILGSVFFIMGYRIKKYNKYYYVTGPWYKKNDWFSGPWNYKSNLPKEVETIISKRLGICFMLVGIGTFLFAIFHFLRLELISVIIWFISLMVALIIGVSSFSISNRPKK